jgi:hypothetical protein
VTINWALGTKIVWTGIINHNVMGEIDHIGYNKFIWNGANAGGERYWHVIYENGNEARLYKQDFYDNLIIIDCKDCDSCQYRFRCFTWRHH